MNVTNLISEAYSMAKFKTEIVSVVVDGSVCYATSVTINGTQFAQVGNGRVNDFLRGFRALTPDDKELMTKFAAEIRAAADTTMHLSTVVISRGEISKCYKMGQKIDIADWELIPIELCVHIINNCQPTIVNTTRGQINFGCSGGSSVGEPLHVIVRRLDNLPRAAFDYFRDGVVCDDMSTMNQHFFRMAALLV